MARADWIGETLSGRYEIVELLGQGGMSAVYKANDPNLRRVVAIKLIHPHLSRDPEFVRRFEEEAAAVAQLRHPNLIQVFDFTNDDATYYIVFEFVPGETLQDRLKRLDESGRLMTIDQTINITAQSADALNYAHNKGLVHRDIKPANIMVNMQNDPIIMDFGIAKIMGGTQHTATGAVLGTARYMSPEQIQGQKIDPRTDIYSLGVTMFEMLGGRPPFDGNSAMTVMMMHMTDPVPDLRDLRADVPPGLVAAINKAMAKDPDERYQTAAEFATAVRDLDLTVAPVNMSLPETKETKPPEAEIATAPAVPAAAAATDSPAHTPSLDPGFPTATTPPAGSGSRNWLYIAGGALVVILLLAGIWAVFLRDDGGGGGEEAPVAAIIETAPAAETAATPTDAPTEEPLEPTKEAPEPTEETPADADAEDSPAESEVEETPTEESTVELSAFEPLPVAASLTNSSGEVSIIVDGEEKALTAETPIVAGSQIATADNSGVEFLLEDGSIIQLGESTILDIRELAEDPADSTQENIFALSDGDFLLRQPQPGNMLVLLDSTGNLLGSLQAPATSSALVKPARTTARRLAQESSDQAILAISLDRESDAIVRFSCFAGLCTLGDSLIVPVGEEVVVDRVERVVLSQEPITDDSVSYTYWQESCASCLPEAAAAVADAGFSTATPEAADEPQAVEAQAVEEPTAEPAATEEAAPELYVRITGIAVDNGGYYEVNYETTGYTEQLPGQHVHFYFDTVPESQAGNPGSGPWILYGGPRPFREYTEFDRPASATAMCARVANPDHSIIYGSGNCYPLP
jgi:eukaryotic-like serine/threonine-protein kinase